MKITTEDLHKALTLAQTIEGLERAKDQAKDTTHEFSVGHDAWGDAFRVKVPVSAAAVREEIARRLTAANAELFTMGFELLPQQAHAAGAGISFVVRTGPHSPFGHGNIAAQAADCDDFLVLER